MLWNISYSMVEMVMRLKEYQIKSRKTAIYPTLELPLKPYKRADRVAMGFLYPALGLAGEAGEVLENIKRIIRDDEGNITEERRAKIEKELGDVGWYWAQLATEFGLNLDDIAKNNLIKLQSRLKRNKIKGDGNNR